MKKSGKTSKQTNGLATKLDLKGFEKRMDQKYATKNDIKDHLVAFEKRMDKKYASKDDIISFKDEILHEIKGMREEVTLVIGYKDQIEDHETRIETVEKHLHIPQ